MGTRLNGDIRREIVRNAIKAQFDPRRAKLDAQERALSLRAYITAVPQKIREHAETIATSKSRHVWFKDYALTNTVTVIGLMGRSYRLLAHADIPTPLGPWGMTLNVADEKHRSLQEAIQDCADAVHKLHSDKNTAIEALQATLKRVQTMEKLLEQWPEGKKFYSSPPLAKPLAVPALRFDQVNAMLGLV